MKSKQQIKSIVYQNKIYGFLLQNTYNSSYSVSNNEYFFPSFPPLGSPKSHHHDSKPTRIQNSNYQCSMISPYPKCLIHPKPCNHPIPLTLPLCTLDFGLKIFVKWQKMK